MEDLEPKIVGVWLPTASPGSGLSEDGPALVMGPGVEPFFIADRSVVDAKMKGRLRAFFRLERCDDGSWTLGEEMPAQDWAPKPADHLVLGPPEHRRWLDHRTDSRGS